MTHLFLSLQAHPFVTLQVPLGSLAQSGLPEEPVLGAGVPISFTGGASAAADADGSGAALGSSAGAADAGGGDVGASAGGAAVWELQWRHSTTNPTGSRCMP